jgi:glycerophosphoryl diester phosphodiesterase
MFPALYAHRLGRAYGPDSSLAALRGALAAPLEGLETDICLTADRNLVLLHDPLLTLNTTLDGWAHERSLAEIQLSRIRDAHALPTEESPLSLDDLLERVPTDLVVQLEVKAHADPDLARRTAEATCDLAAARGFRSRLVVWADYAPEALAAWAVRNGLVGISVEHFLFTEPLVKVMRLAGLSLNTGTVNNAELLRGVLELEPDAICTDRPHELRREMASLGIEPEQRLTLAV